MPRLMSGSVIRRSVYSRLAPRLSEQSSSNGLSCCTAAPTMRITKGVQMTIWPTVSVQIDNRTDIRLNTMSKARPNAIAGSTIGDMKRLSRKPAQALRLRAMPSAAAVPSTLHVSVAQNASLRLVQVAAINSSDCSSSLYQRSDQLGGGNLSVCAPVNEVINTTTVGASRSTIATTATIQTSPEYARSAGLCRIYASHARLREGIYQPCD